MQTKKGCEKLKAGPAIFVVSWSVKRPPLLTLPLRGHFSAAHKIPVGILGQSLGTQECNLASWEGSSEADVATRPILLGGWGCHIYIGGPEVVHSSA